MALRPSLPASTLILLALLVTRPASQVTVQGPPNDLEVESRLAACVRAETLALRARELAGGDPASRASRVQDLLEAWPLDRVQVPARMPVPAKARHAELVVKAPGDADPVSLEGRAWPGSPGCRLQAASLLAPAELWAEPPEEPCVAWMAGPGRPPLHPPLETLQVRELQARGAAAVLVGCTSWDGPGVPLFRPEEPPALPVVAVDARACKHLEETLALPPSRRPKVTLMLPEPGARALVSSVVAELRGRGEGPRVLVCAPLCGAGGGPAARGSAAGAALALEALRVLATSVAAGELPRPSGDLLVGFWTAGAPAFGAWLEETDRPPDVVLTLGPCESPHGKAVQLELTALVGRGAPRAAAVAGSSLQAFAGRRGFWEALQSPSWVPGGRPERARYRELRLRMPRATWLHLTPASGTLQDEGPWRRYASSDDVFDKERPPDGRLLERSARALLLALHALGTDAPR